MNRNNQLGFGILEVAIASFIFAIVVAVTATFFVYFFRNYNFAFEEARSINEVESAVRIVGQELREAAVSEEGAYPLMSVNDQELTFFADSDNDGLVERVRYFLSGATLSRGLIEPGSPPNVYDEATETTKIISENVRNGVDPIFYYYNEDWPADVVNNPLAQADRLLDTRVIKVDLKVNTDPGGVIEDFQISTEVMLRNLKDN